MKEFLVTGVTSPAPSTVISCPRARAETNGRQLPRSQEHRQTSDGEPLLVFVGPHLFPPSWMHRYSACDGTYENVARQRSTPGVRRMALKVHTSKSRTNSMQSGEIIVLEVTASDVLDEAE
ncbi:hypothetical protein X777_06006 [Ooceraea biroi]|uniref:Uncharacterized protein n=1 Tax=Ooceraea biroi TaxID=2015173 RepID=A0A026WES9_OOCBI|nr:hypothetical protein X777_06006 [Ooceraea biroi]